MLVALVGKLAFDIRPLNVVEVDVSALGIGQDEFERPGIDTSASEPSVVSGSALDLNRVLESDPGRNVIAL